MELNVSLFTQQESECLHGMHEALVPSPVLQTGSTEHGLSWPKLL